jgi:enoyl-CoA hydratase/carnithine racemase
VTELIDIAARGPAAVITLRREDKLNALSSELEGALSDALREDRVRDSACVIVAGGARAFSAGADVNEMRDLDPASILGIVPSSGGTHRLARLRGQRGQPLGHLQRPVQGRAGAHRLRDEAERLGLLRAKALAQQHQLLRPARAHRWR